MATKKKNVANKRGAPRKRKPVKPNTSSVVTMIEAAWCHFVLQGKTYREAAVEIGQAPEQGESYSKKPSVHAYMEKFSDAVLQGAAHAEVAKLLKAGITRDGVAQRYWYLANLEPTMTRGTIDGQIEALRGLTELMSFKLDPKTVPDALKGMSNDELEAFSTGGRPQ